MNLLPKNESELMPSEKEIPVLSLEKEQDVRSHSNLSISSLPSRPVISETVAVVISDEEDLRRQLQEVIEWKPHRQEVMIMATVSIISLMVALDATILVPVLPELAVSLHGTSTDAFWVGTSYLLTSSVFQPFTSALSDIFGRQELLLASLVFFTVGSIVCAIAHDFTTLIAGRCVQGVGGGGVITMGQVIFSDIVPLRQRPKWFSLPLASWALGSISGPLLGGVFVQYTTWRWVFYINLPFCGIGIVMIMLYVRLRTEKTSLRSKLLRVDWLGGFLFISGITSFLIGLSWSGVQFSWTSFRSLVPIIVGILGVIASLIWERLGAREPFLRRSIFYNASAVAAYMCALFQGLLLFCSMYYAPFYLMSVRGISPLSAGVNLLPVTCLLLPSSAIISILITRLGHLRWAIWLGWAFTTTGCGLLILMGEHTRTGVRIMSFMVFGLGNGIVLSSVNFSTQAIARVEDCGRAASMYTFMRTLGMTIGVAVGGTVFQNVMAHKLSALHLPTSIADDAEGFVAVMKTLAVDDPTRVGARHAYVQGFKGVFTVITGISAVGLVASAFIQSHGMNKRLSSTYVVQR